MRRITALLLLLLSLLAPIAGADEGLELTRPDGWPDAAWAAEVKLERHLLAAPRAERLRALHDMCCARPHPAGTEQDRWMIEQLRAEFERCGVKPRVEPFFPYLPRFVNASLTLVEGDTETALPVREQDEGDDFSDVEGDSETYYAEVLPGWNAYSGSGSVTAEVVYANRGTKQDFETLEQLGVSCKGKIVVARYGGNYRGFKAKFAEAAGAAGLIMYTDPADSGWGRGLSWPEGGWASPSSIQRGSIKTLAYPGDPLTPFVPATKDAERLDPATVALPTIPVQCVGWVAAQPILQRMRGRDVPKGWQGGLPFRYRVTHGDASFRVRLTVEQERRVVETANVLGVIEGAVWPQEKVVVGCHFDAWTFGAGDPHAGTILLFAMAEAFGQAAAAGMRPARTIVFANWGAEEMGIIGSTEWCETHADDLRANAVAYLNLDMAAMGTRFRASADPLLKSVVEAVGHVVPAADGKQSVHDSVTEPNRVMKLGVLGGGSDHVGFYLHLGVPSMSLGAGGSNGVSYHSAHDNLRWYRRVVGDDYLGAVMLTRMASLIVARLANTPLHPLGLDYLAWDLHDHLSAIRERAGALGVALVDPERRFDDRVTDLVNQSQRLGNTSGSLGLVVERVRHAVSANELTPEEIIEVNGLLRGLSRAWLSDEGLPGRPWYRSLYASTDPNSGYAAWMLPELREAIENKDENGAQLALIHIGERIAAVEAMLVKLKVIYDRAVARR